MNNIHGTTAERHAKLIEIADKMEAHWKWRRQNDHENQGAQKFSICTCATCRRHNRWRDVIHGNSAADKDAVLSEIIGLVMDLEMDRDYEKAIETGVWPQSVEILERRAAKMLALAEKFKNDPPDPTA